jgi:hypothetical protein
VAAIPYGLVSETSADTQLNAAVSMIAIPSASTIGTQAWVAVAGDPKTRHRGAAVNCL